MRKRPCLLFACIFLTGIIFQRYMWKWSWLVLFIVLLLELCQGIKYMFSNELKAHYFTSTYEILKQVAGRSVILLSAFFLGMNQMKSQEEFRDTYMSKLTDNSDAVIYGEIVEIKETEYGCRLILSDCHVSLKEAVIPCNKVMVYASSDQFCIGQIYQIKGKLHFFEHARNEGNFDSALFYQSQKIDFFLYEKSSVLLAFNDNVIRDGILSLKFRMEQVYKNSLSETAAGFYMGMMLGDKSLLSEETKDLFAIGGISHILAISGLHMSIIGRGFYSQLRKHRLGFLLSGVLASVLVLSYCYMVGSGTSAIRAVGMMLLFFFAQYIGRSYDMLNALGAVVIYLLWENPFLIEYSGFWFSVTALIGIGFVGKNMWTSLGITLSTLPIVASCYYEVPLYSAFVNAIALPLLTPVFVLALFGSLIGCVFPLVGGVLLIPCSWLFYFYEWLCEFVGELPFGTVITGAPEMWTVVFYYIVLLAGCLILKIVNQEEEEGEDKLTETQNERKKIQSRKGIVPGILLVATCFTIILWPKKAISEIIFLDVGQGDGIYISSVDGITCFIDGGSSDVKQVGKYRILPFLKAHGVKQIDYWFVSHADSDHISGLLEVMEAGYKIGHLVISDKMPKDESRENILSLAEYQEIYVIQMKAGESIQSVSGKKDGVRITSLYPWTDAADKNEQSLVLLVEFLDDNGVEIYKALFSGDISSSGEMELIRKDVLEDVDLYKAAHHGSKYSNSKSFLEVVQPEICVISCSADNSYGHPHTEAVENMENVGSEVLYTMESGQITIQKPKLK